MSLREWKKLAESKTKAGKMKNQLYNQITAEKIKSKTSDAAITKAFRLDEIIEGLKGKPAPPRVRKRVPVKIEEEEGIDYAPEVDPYEDMDVEGFLNLEDYVPPQGEKQIAPKPAKYQIDLSYWQIDPGDLLTEPPPDYDQIDDEQLAIEAPPDEGEDEELEGEEDQQEANKILDYLDLPNYDDIRKRLDEPEMTATKQRNYLQHVIENADKRRWQVLAMKSHATKKFKKGESMQRKEIEYMEILLNFEESLMITLNNINLKANQSKVMGLKDSWAEESIFTMILKNYYKNQLSSLVKSRQVIPVSR